MIARRRLGEPDIAWRTQKKEKKNSKRSSNTCVSRQLARLECCDNGVAVANLASRCVHDVRSSFHAGQHLGVKQMFRLWMERAIDGDHVAHARKIRGSLVERQLQLE